MIIAHANLGRGVTTDEFTRNLKAVLSAGGKRAVFCFQEIDEADAPNEMDILLDLTKRTHHVVGDRTAVPILVPNHLEVVGRSQTLACRGLAKYTPHRIINEAVVRLGPNLDVAVLNTHLPLNRAATFTRRRQVRKVLKARARTHEAGVWIADTNTRRGWPTIVRGERVVTDAGIDKAKAWGPADRRIEVSDRRTVPLTIDGHDAHVARVIWHRA